MDSDSEIEEYSSWKGVPANVILINAFDSKYNTIAVAHAATCRVIKRYLRLSGPEQVAVSIYGTINDTSSNLNLQSVIDIFPLTSPTLDDYFKLKNAKVASYKHAHEFNLSEVLWHASKLFTNCKKQLSTRTVVILSRLDIPPALTDQNPTLNRVMDLVSLGINIKIINISEGQYEIDPFYEKFIKTISKDLDIPAPVWDYKDIEQMIYQRTQRNLAVAKLTFEIGDNVSIGVGIYSLVRKIGEQSLKKCKVDRQTNEIITTFNKTVKVSIDPVITRENDMDVDEEGPKQMPVLKSELHYYEVYGGEKISFTSSEKKQLDNPFGTSVLKLLGFKPAHIMCKEKWFLKRGYFMFPNESIIEGSTVAFKALHQACIDKSVVALCMLRTRTNTKTTIVALSPCSHPLGLDVEIGFDIIHIPFIENVRDVPEIEESNIDISDKQKAFMREILTQLTFDYSPDMFEDPKLQSEYRAVEAIALDEEEPFIDTTKPDSKKFHEIREGLFEELFGPFGVVQKRTAEQAGFCKKVKVQEDIDYNLLKNYISEKTVNNKYTVEQLKQILKSHNIDNLPALNGLKKMQLVDLVYKYCT